MGFRVWVWGLGFFAFLAIGVLGLRHFCFKGFGPAPGSGFGAEALALRCTGLLLVHGVTSMDIIVGSIYDSVFL